MYQKSPSSSTLRFIFSLSLAGSCCHSVDLPATQHNLSVLSPPSLLSLPPLYLSASLLSLPPSLSLLPSPSLPYSTHPSLQGPFHSFWPQGFLSFRILTQLVLRPSTAISPEDSVSCTRADNTMYMYLTDQRLLNISSYKNVMYTHNVFF